MRVTVDGALRRADRTILNVFLGALVFGCAVFLVTRFFDRAPGIVRNPRAFDALRILLSACAGLAGGILLSHGPRADTAAGIAILVATFAAVAFASAGGRPAPLIVVGSALAIVVGSALLSANAGPFFSALAGSAPFAATYLIARGSSDWRDALVAALGAATFGLVDGLIAIGVACLVTAVYRRWLQMRKQPIGTPRFAAAFGLVFLIALVGKLAIT